MRDIFMDYQSTTPVDPRVMETMLPYFTNTFGNPHSSEHRFGITAQHAVDQALKDIGQVIGASAREIVLTSGATESNNLALRGALPKRGKSHLISCVTEHSSVLSTLSSLQENGCSVTCLPVGDDGLIDLEALAASITASTRIVSLMAVNSEIGVVQPFADAGAICRDRGVLFHVDAAQAYGRVPIDVHRQHIDLLSVSAHKIYGPKGIGALFMNDRARQLLRPQITGGKQQDGLRAGTVPVPLAVGFATAARLMVQEGVTESHRISSLAGKLLTGLAGKLAGVHLNGSAVHRYPGNLNLRIEEVDADSLLLMLPEIAMSTGSACSSGTPEPSPVLMALGLSKEEASQCLRLGLGRMTTEEDVDYVIERLAWAVGKLRD
ncbi:cysteine desulfurase family protein [Xanthomonas hortorum pv. vitians]|uniref:cysteine desulfurase family protein n=1 Tax=Xanthomonas hortorum TaxID=56454 RepID=UPI0025A247D4|nr:cysteine desulfurase family protein [Xanthomonas hortorum]WJM78532.1 cysteine desulfurase family protein [Xanthomonas hortorum pv. vitians]